MKKESSILLGFQVGDGAPVNIPLRHMAVCGQTGESGKTTTMEALIGRAGVRALAFITKRGEGSFLHAHSVPPYFREGAAGGRPYWEFVESIVASTMGQKMKFERAWIVKASKGAKTLADVRRNIPGLIEQARRSMDKDIFMLLGEYLDIVLPQIARLPASERVKLAPGLNVMDLTPYTEEMQMLVVRSAVEWIYKNETGVVTILPEAWKFIPEGRMTPVKHAAERLIREGAALGNWVWIDSQDLAGVWKLMLRAATVWLVGVQREANEIGRTLDNIPAGIKRPTAGDIARLGRGQFFACWKDEVRKTYVWPAWMNDEADARAIAEGALSTDHVYKPPPPDLPRPSKPEPEKPMPESNVEKKLDALINLMSQRAQSTPVMPSSPAMGDEEALYQRFKERLIAEAPGLLKVITAQPEIEVKVERKTLQIDGASTIGRTARLLAQGFFREPQTSSAVRKELARTGPDTNNKTLSLALAKLVRDGFLTDEQAGFREVPKMKVRIKEDGD